MKTFLIVWEHQHGHSIRTLCTPQALSDEKREYDHNQEFFKSNSERRERHAWQSERELTF